MNKECGSNNLNKQNLSARVNYEQYFFFANANDIKMHINPANFTNADQAVQYFMFKKQFLGLMR